MSSPFSRRFSARTTTITMCCIHRPPTKAGETRSAFSPLAAVLIRPQHQSHKIPPRTRKQIRESLFTNNRAPHARAAQHSTQKRHLQPKIRQRTSRIWKENKPMKAPSPPAPPAPPNTAALAHARSWTRARMSHKMPAVPRRNLAGTRLSIAASGSQSRCLGGVGDLCVGVGGRGGRSGRGAACV